MLYRTSGSQGAEALYLKHRISFMIFVLKILYHE